MPTQAVPAIAAVPKDFTELSAMTRNVTMSGDVSSVLTGNGHLPAMAILAALSPVLGLFISVRRAFANVQQIMLGAWGIRIVRLGPRPYITMYGRGVP